MPTATTRNLSWRTRNRSSRRNGRPTEPASAYVSFEPQEADSVRPQPARWNARRSWPISKARIPPPGMVARRQEAGGGADQGRQLEHLHDQRDGSGLARFTNTQAIDTEPNFSRDGRYILFTSDRAGSPQIYRMRADGEGEAERMTFEGSYNVTPRHSPDGKSFIFIHRSEGRFNVAAVDLGSRQMQILTAEASINRPRLRPTAR